MNTWWLGHIFGLSGLIFSILDIVNSRNLFNGMPIEFQLAIGFFTTLYVFWQSLRAYERWRMDRLENKEKIIDIERKEIELKQLRKQVAAKK
jgi:hypothetical protein